MSSPLILTIETATTVCSVSICKGNEIIALKEINNGFSHAENLHVFINDLFIQQNLSLHSLSAVAFSKGPGSYTGLRIGASAAKGLCYALNIPLIAINTLKVMTVMALKKTELAEALYCPMLDARRMEVYMAIYDAKLNEVKKTEAKIVNNDTLADFNFAIPVFFYGEGMNKCRDLLSQFSQSHFIEDIYPSSQHMVKLAYEAYEQKKFEDIAYFEPFYLKEFYSGTKQ